MERSASTHKITSRRRYHKHDPHAFLHTFLGKWGRHVRCEEGTLHHCDSCGYVTDVLAQYASGVVLNLAIYMRRGPLNAAWSSVLFVEPATSGLIQCLAFSSFVVNHFEKNRSGKTFAAQGTVLCKYGHGPAVSGFRLVDSATQRSV